MNPHWKMSNLMVPVHRITWRTSRLSRRLLNITLGLGIFFAPSFAEAVAPAPTLLERAFVLDQGTASHPPDRAAAAALYRAAAEQDDAFAHLRLGYLAETGDGLPQDYERARAHYEAAAKAGLTEARLRLAMCHLEGWGGPVDRAAFVRELIAAAEVDYTPAQRVLASVFFFGIAVPVDRTEGLRWLERAAALEDTAAQYQLGSRADDLWKRGLAFMPDRTLARTWYQLSAEQDYQTAMRAMANTFLTGTREERDWDLGQRWLRLATDGGDAEAPYILAVFELLHIDSAQPNIEQARTWLRLASERGNSRASEVLQFELEGRPLGRAMRHVLRAPYEDRYIEQATAHLGDAPTREPMIVRMVRPVYPAVLRLTETDGTAVIAFVVDPTGQVTDATVKTASHPLFGEAAVEAVKQWRFQPGRVDGHVMNCRMEAPIVFSVQNEDLLGVDAVLIAAAELARQLGPEIAADAYDLRMAVAKSRLPKPEPPEGTTFPPDVHGMVLIALDRAGAPLRAHILAAEPENLGPALRNVALSHEFKPRILNGEAIPSNVVLRYHTGRFLNPIFRKPD